MSNIRVVHCPVFELPAMALESRLQRSAPALCNGTNGSAAKVRVAAGGLRQTQREASGRESNLGLPGVFECHGTGQEPA